MNQSYEEPNKPKIKRANESGKKNKTSVEAIKVTIEKKRQCNAKALDIVTSFSDRTVSESCLVESLPFISQEHYQDIIEERAINKLCGYPPCERTLEKIPTKQYHISTTHNKVFDITDRKNFCSNLCYKASKYLKDQILTSPLWLRDKQSSTVYRLISLQSKGGIVGEEVDLGHSCIKPDPDETSSTTSVSSTGSAPTALLETNIDNLETKVYTNQYNDDTTKERKDLNSRLSPDGSESCNIHNNSTDREHSLAKSSHENDISNSSLHTSTCIKSNEILIESPSKDFTAKPVDLPEKPVSAIEDVSSSLSTIVYNKEKYKVEIESLNEDKTSECVDSGVSDVALQKPVTKSRKTLHKRKTSGKDTQNHLSPIQCVVLKVEQILKEWLTFDSLCLLLGEDKVKEMLSEKSDCIREYYNKTFTAGDTYFYERYLAICKKLNILELEDTKVDASFREEAKKPLPDYETLKEEAKNMDLKVKMFYRGDKQVQFEEPSNEEIEKVLSEEPILPLVDLHAQKALRRRIVIDKLRRVLQDLQKSLGLRGFNFSEEVRTLIGTFSLSAHNITMKPGEWNLVAIIIIKLLSLKDENLEQALSSTSTRKHLILLLMSYSLDTGYLDRLTVWLTDIESMIQKVG